jgi:hypothetical protein
VEQASPKSNRIDLDHETIDIDDDGIFDDVGVGREEILIRSLFS